jgi:3-phenylpropionate/cinnamic acid dioxygenase small subunit
MAMTPGYKSLQTGTEAGWSSLLDRLRIEDQLSILGRCLDERDFDGLRKLFTRDATVTTPGGTAVGHDELVDQARRRHSLDDGIQHVITNTLIELDGDRASVRANLLVSFARAGAADPKPFLLGEVYQFELQRLGEDWRIATLRSTPVWSVNRPTS